MSTQGVAKLDNKMRELIKQLSLVVELGAGFPERSGDHFGSRFYAALPIRFCDGLIVCSRLCGPILRRHGESVYFNPNCRALVAQLIAARCPSAIVR